MNSGGDHPMPSQRKNAIISILFIVFGGPAILLVYIPFWITRFRIPANEPRWQLLLACALIAAGIVPLIESTVRFIRISNGTLVPTTATEHLVVSGLYRYARNPMYAGVVASLAAEAALFRSPDLVVVLGLAALGF